MPCLQDEAANKFIQERFVPKLVASGITLVVDVVRKPDETSPPGLAIIKKAEEIDAALIVIAPHEHEFMEVGNKNPIPALKACSSLGGGVQHLQASVRNVAPEACKGVQQCWSTAPLSSNVVLWCVLC